MRAVAIIALLCVGLAAGTTRPIIGIFTQPNLEELEQKVHRNSNVPQKLNILCWRASYVKYIENAGARVVPIRYDANATELTALFNSLNGFLFPGGGTDIDGSQWGDAALLMYNLAIEANQNGDYFPVWGTCFGFQVISMLQSQNYTLLGNTSSENLTLPLQFVGNPSDTRMFANASLEVLQTLGAHDVTMNNHMFSVYTDSFYSQSSLYDFFTVISTNEDRYGVEFVSTMEGIEYPIYASQWHPEKNQFEWNPAEVINHSTEAIAAMQYMADFFVTEARKNSHAFPSLEEETAALIYNYQPVFTEALVSDFEQCYFFDWL